MWRTENKTKERREKEKYELIGFSKAPKFGDQHSITGLTGSVICSKCYGEAAMAFQKEKETIIMHAHFAAVMFMIRQ